MARRASGSLRRVIDVGINCLGADLTGAREFGEVSYQLRADWERWWIGPALKERLYRCGAIDRASEMFAVARASWTDEYANWQAGLRFATKDEADLAGRARGSPEGW